MKQSLVESSQRKSRKEKKNAKVEIYLFIGRKMPLPLFEKWIFSRENEMLIEKTHNYG